jgi:hypothetical protein
VAALVATMAVGAVAAQASLPNRNTVYQGEYALSQGGGFSNDLVQFEVSPSGRELTHLAFGIAVCAPPPTLVEPNVNVPRNGDWTKTFGFSTFHVTLKGRFTAGGRASGTAVLHTETILGQPCTITGRWTARPLPADWQSCPQSVAPTNTATNVTVHKLSCAQAWLTIQAGDRLGQQQGPSGGFSPPGFACHSSPTPGIRELCARGGQIFTLPD